MPPAVTASTGLDALTQVIEPFVSARANPMTDAFCREGMVRGARSLRRAWQRGDDAAAREDMALTSLLGGLALANAGLGAVHGIASVVGGMFAAPHGAVCARLLPAVMAMNVRALRRRQTTSDAVSRFDEVARLLTGQADADASDGAVWVQRLCSDLHTPLLSAYGLTRQDIATVAEKSLVASSTKANPIVLTIEEMKDIIEEAV
jgi:alcohol dehydrogenase class IV